MWYFDLNLHLIGWEARDWVIGVALYKLPGDAPGCFDDPTLNVDNIMQRSRKLSRTSRFSSWRDNSRGPPLASDVRFQQLVLRGVWPE